ncbi:hypothetical protein [Arthrobacter cryoconiti]|uniref:Uncharacterized protein n=1 Tax=Arthrobacter cryoconiti TaxID=748907 RepID=A0ABV8R310_9MICC|nr:hypothetical protein [Arthrobacter cryoconiti]MCC9067018.1 hypothetical protein [Arthrobacter cryoconiti]
MSNFLRGLKAATESPALIAVTGKYHGLGNRVRVVLGCRTLAQAEGRSFAYTWPTGPTFGARLDQLWEFDAPVVPLPVSRLLALRSPYVNHSLDWLDADARTQRLWQIRTPHAIVLPTNLPSWETELRKLTPTKEVIRLIESAANDGPSVHRGYVGVMIRTKSNAHALTLKHSPLEWYLERMSQLRVMWPDVPFYVCADTPEAFLRAQQAFSGCFGTEDKGKYNSLSALRASVADLYMLAGSSHLLGPHYSSFPELAQLLAGAKLRLETSMTPEQEVPTTTSGLSVAANPTRPFERTLVL